MTNSFDMSRLDQWNIHITPEFQYTKKLLNYASRVVESKYTRNSVVSRKSLSANVLMYVQSDVDGLAFLNIKDPDLQYTAKICYSPMNDAMSEEKLAEWEMMDKHVLVLYAIETTHAFLRTLSEKIANNPNLKYDKWSNKTRLNKTINNCRTCLNRFRTALETHCNENLRSKPLRL